MLRMLRPVQLWQIAVLLVGAFAMLMQVVLAAGPRAHCDRRGEPVGTFRSSQGGGRLTARRGSGRIRGRPVDRAAGPPADGRAAGGRRHRQTGCAAGRSGRLEQYCRVMALRQLRVIDAVSMAQSWCGCISGSAGRQVLLVTDPLRRWSSVGAGAIQDVGAEYTLTVMPSRHMERATELTKILDAGLQAADVIIGMNGSSGAPTYSKTVAELLAQKRIRAMSMVMRSMDNWTRGGALADYEELNRKGHELADVWAAVDGDGARRWHRLLRASRRTRS